MARAIVTSIALYVSLLIIGAHAADTYPNRPIRLIVPQAAGSASDIVSRIASAKMSELLGQQIVIDNRTGATGIIGVELAARAAPNGYTLLAGSALRTRSCPSFTKSSPTTPCESK